MAENEDGQDKSESPTARRRQQAIDEGQIPRSQELASAAVLLAGAASISMVGGRSLGTFTMRVMHESASSLSADPMTMVGAVSVLRLMTFGLLGALAPYALGIMVVSIGINLAQTRGVTSFGPIKPRFAALNPMNGFKRIFGLDALINLPKSILKLAALGFVTVSIIRASWPELMSLAQTGPAAILTVLQTLGVKLMLLTGLAFLVIAGADYAWVLFRHEQRIRMTKQEVTLEHKEMEGDPQIKARIRTMQRQRARQRMLQAVPRADVVITNPTHVAVALRYDPEVSPAPIVVAMGERKLAERIKQLARDAKVPMVENKPVARALLATCVVGKSIPPGLYAAVAEILAYVFRQQNPRYGPRSHRSAA